MNSPVWTRHSVARLAAAACPVPAAAALRKVAGPGRRELRRPTLGSSARGRLSQAALCVRSDVIHSLIGGARLFNYLTAAI